MHHPNLSYKKGEAPRGGAPLPRVVCCHGWPPGGFRDAPILLAHHRSHCDGRRSINDGARSRTSDADAGLSGHDDHSNARGKTRAYLHGHRCRLHCRTVQGFGYPDSIKITRESEFTVDFADSKDDMSIIGIIDRVTRHVNATSFLMDPKIGKNREISYALTCRPTQGMF
jgi:hypothetical protein